MKLRTHATTSLALSFCVGGVCAKAILGTNPELVGGIIPVLCVGTAILGTFAAGIAPNYDTEKSDLCECDGTYGMIWEQNLDRRGLTHTLLGAVGYSGLLFGILYLILSLFTSMNLTWLLTLMAGTFVGYLWHMVADTLTPQGIMWLYPVIKYPFRIPLIRDTFTELVFELIAVIGFVELAVKIWGPLLVQ